MGLQRELTRCGLTFLSGTGRGGRISGLALVSDWGAGLPVTRPATRRVVSVRTRIVDQVATVMWGAVRMAVAGAAGRVLVLYTIAIMGRTLAVGGGSTPQKLSTKLNSYCSLATCYATT